MSVIKEFRINKNRAIQISKEVAAAVKQWRKVAVKQWRKVAVKFGLSKVECDFMRSAFEWE
jgi:hypothetical protein